MKIRVLDGEEHGVVLGTGAFVDAVEPPSPEHSAIVVAEDDDGNLLGYWCAFDTVHVEPLWIHPDCRKNPAIGRGLWGGLKGYLASKGVPGAFAMIHDSDVGTHLPMAARLGFERIPASIVFVDLTKKDVEV